MLTTCNSVPQSPTIPMQGGGLDQSGKIDSVCSTVTDYGKLQD